MSLWQRIRPFFLVDLTTGNEPFSLGHWQRDRDAEPEEDSQPAELPNGLPTGLEGDLLTPDLDGNLARIRQVFSLPHSQGLVIHRISLSARPPRDAAVLYVAGMVDMDHLSRSVLAPLLNEARLSGCTEPHSLFLRVLEEGQGAIRQAWDEVVKDLFDGAAAILVAGEPQAVTVRMEGWPKRSIDRPQVEVTVRGPQEAFTEDLRTNVAQVRRRLRTPDFTVELGSLGQLSRTDLAVLYLKSIANARLVAEVRRRIAGVKVDYIADAGSLMQFIEDHPRSIYPTVLSTERPDRVAAQISEGYVAILIDNDPHALIVPTTIPSMLHSAEDAYLRWPSGTFMRLTRVAAYYVSLLMPALYIALVNFRQEMIPTPLLLAIAQSRETVPFSAIVEVMLMEGSFELIHEAALRVPTVIGPTIGIVGSLILGQAAVAAGIISPILVIITSATALASFAIPTYELQMAARIMRFAYIFAAGVLGISGLVLLHTAYVAHLCSINSFGAPFLSPIAPNRPSGDSIFRAPAFMLDKRPELVRPKQSRQQAPDTRPWAPSQPGQKQKEEPDD